MGDFRTVPILHNSLMDTKMPSGRSRFPHAIKEVALLFNEASIHTIRMRNNVPLKSKVSSSIFSSGFSGYIRVRPPEPKRELKCKEDTAKSENENSDEKQASTS